MNKDREAIEKVRRWHKVSTLQIPRELISGLLEAVDRLLSREELLAREIIASSAPERVSDTTGGWSNSLEYGDGAEGPGIYAPESDGALLSRIIADESFNTDEWERFARELVDRWNAAPRLARALIGEGD